MSKIAAKQQTACQGGFANEQWLEIAKVELQSRDCYKYQVLNDDLDTAVHEINHIICDELAKRNAE